MANKKIKKNQIQESLKLMNQCPVCQGHYSEKDAKILEEKAGVNLIHITCPHCYNHILAVVIVSQLGMSTVGMVTDLTADDVKRLYTWQSVSEDEVLDFHQILKTNQFKFINL